MCGEAITVAGIGFAVVFITLILLAMSVKIMSFFCRGIGRRRGAKR
jgi:Na+-transporting methylmalonyl-CoA/oxaloacetate decarboxylase gamma subunit